MPILTYEEALEVIADLREGLENLATQAEMLRKQTGLEGPVIVCINGKLVEVQQILTQTKKIVCS